MEQQVARAAGLMKALSNRHRLLVLCELEGGEEVSVGALCERIGISQSALSQHLARLRRDGLVVTRREKQTIHYRLAEGPVSRLLALLYDIYCRSDTGGCRRPEQSDGR